eukprot:Opistho-2@20061
MRRSWQRILKGAAGSAMSGAIRLPTVAANIVRRLFSINLRLRNGRTALSVGLLVVLLLCAAAALITSDVLQLPVSFKLSPSLSGTCNNAANGGTLGERNNEDTKHSGGIAGAAALRRPTSQNEPLPSHEEAFEQQWQELLNTPLDGTPLYAFRPPPTEANWRNWHVEQVRMGMGGKLEIARQESPSDATGRAWTTVPVPADAYFQLFVSVSCPFGRVLLNITDGGSDHLLLPFTYVNGATKHAKHYLFRSLTISEHVIIGFTIHGGTNGDHCILEELRLSLIAPTRNFIPPSFLLPNANVEASLATTARRPPWMLANAISSLYPFVNKIRVFLNGHETIPESLRDDPKIEVAMSRLWGDYGDANKFFWIEKSTSDYSVVFDDDIFFAVDYVGRQVAKLRDYGDHAVLGGLCCFVSQPDVRYYERGGRSTRRHMVLNPMDYPVHVLGTGTIVFPTKLMQLRMRDFQFPNMADIWFAVKAQQLKVPLICAARPNKWIMHAEGTNDNSIWTTMSAKMADNVHESSRVRPWEFLDDVLRAALPITTQPIVYRGIRRLKLVLGLSTWNRKDYLARCLDGFLRTRSQKYDWTVIIADDGSTDGTLEYIQSILPTFPHEIFVLRNRGRYAGGQTNTMLELAMKIGFDLGFRVDDDVLFQKRGWDELYVNAVSTGPYEHLAFLHVAHRLELFQKVHGKGGMELPPPTRLGDSLVSHVSVQDVMGAFWTFTPRLIRTIGYIDELNFPTRGQWHTDFSVRASRAGFNSMETFFDADGSNAFLDLQNMVDAAGYRSSLPWGPEYKKTKNPEELVRRRAVINDTSRVYIPHRRPVFGLPMHRITLNTVFDRIYVMNLDRRQDRWQHVLQQTRALDIDVQRFPAIDGLASPHKEEYEAYSQSPLVPNPNGEMGVRTIRYAAEYHTDYDSV